MEKQLRPFFSADTMEEYSGGMDGGTALPDTDVATDDLGTSDDLGIEGDPNDETGLTDNDADDHAGSYEMGAETVSGGRGLTNEESEP
jgi:hypothetical protein